MALWRYGKYQHNLSYSDRVLTHSESGISTTDSVNGTPPDLGFFMLTVSDWGFSSSYGFYQSAPATLFTQVGDIGYRVSTTQVTKYRIDEITETTVYLTAYDWESCTENSSQGDYIEEVEAEYGTYPDDGPQDGYWWVAISPVVTAPNIRMGVGGAYKLLESAKTGVNGAWKTSPEAWIGVNGSWKKLE
jgi:hypothetical protein